MVRGLGKVLGLGLVFAALFAGAAYADAPGARPIKGNFDAPGFDVASATPYGKTLPPIGYVEFSYADQNKLTYASMANKAGKVFAPTMDASGMV